MSGAQGCVIKPRLVLMMNEVVGNAKDTAPVEASVLAEWNHGRALGRAAPSAAIRAGRELERDRPSSRDCPFPREDFGRTVITRNIAGMPRNPPACGKTAMSYTSVRCFSFAHSSSWESGAEDHPRLSPVLEIFVAREPDRPSFESTHVDLAFMVEQELSRDGMLRESEGVVTLRTGFFRRNSDVGPIGGVGGEVALFLACTDDPVAPGGVSGPEVANE